MKIGIVTWHKGNIGGSLQAYALSESVKKIGYEPVFLNLINKRIDPIVWKIRSFAFHICFLKSGLTRDYTYKFIRNRVNESPNLLYNELSNYTKKFGALICGSDQIWSCVDEVNPFYFLQFADEKRRISYAPSIGLNTIREEFQSDFIKYVSSIPYLSVRETKGQEIIKTLTGREPKVVLDPTLLLDKNDWLSLANEANIAKFGLRKGEYILCYYLGNHKQYTEYTKSLSQKTGKRVIQVSFKRKNLGKKQIVCSVEEFLALIDNSFCVLTDSFHGTILPLNMEKKVAVFERFSQDDPLNQNSRIYNILNKLGIENWIVSPYEDVDGFINRIDNWDRIRTALNTERHDSINYLITSINKACK